MTDYGKTLKVSTWHRDPTRLNCPHRARDSQRSTVSRVYLCFYGAAVTRCMLTKCPRVRWD